MIASRWFRPAILVAALVAITPALAEDYWANDDWAMADAQADLSEAVGDLPVYEVRVDRYGIGVLAGDPQSSEGLHQISWREGVLTDYPDLTPHAFGFDDTEPFPFSELDLTALPSIKAAAFEAFDSPDARIVSSMVATKPIDRASKKRIVLWEIELRQADRQEGEVLLTASGQVVHVKLPDSRLADAGPWLAPANVAALLVRLESEFGAEARFAEIRIYDDDALIYVEDRQHPGQLATFSVDPQEIWRFPASMRTPMEPTLDRPFTIADIRVASALALGRLETDTLARLELEGLAVTRYTISRGVLLMTPEDDRLAIEVRADLGNGQTGGWVTYDMGGQPVDIAMP